MECPICVKKPNNHDIYIKGFYKLENNDFVIFIRPIEAYTLEDYHCIEAHLKKTLDEPQKWKLVFDVEGLSLWHIIDPRASLSIPRLISYIHEENIREIYIMNTNWLTSSIMMMTWPFISTKIQKKIRFL